VPDQPTDLQRQADLVTALARRIETESADGGNPLADLRENPICSLTIDREIPCLFVDWRGYATSAQIRYVHESMILLFWRYGIGKVLVDNTNLRMFGAEDQAWAADDWLPRAAAAGYRVGAITRSRSYFAEQALESVVQAAAGTVTLRFFDNRDEARTWLKGQPA
jgi:hypothetical protein